MRAAFPAGMSRDVTAESLHRVEEVLAEHPELHDVFETWATACLDEWTEHREPGTAELEALREKLHLELAKATWGERDALTRARRAWLEYLLDTLDEMDAGPTRSAA